MASLDLNLDTSTEDLTVRLNGKKLDGVVGVHCYKMLDYDGKIRYELSINMQQMDGEDNVRTYTGLTVTKADSQLGKQIAAEGRILQKEGDLIYFSK